MIKNVILLILLLSAIFAFTQCEETEILRTSGGREYEIQETVQIFTDGIEVKTNQGNLIFTYEEIDTIYKSKIHRAWENEKLMRFY